ncbi:MAG: multicopper oxidase domain-containing protein, partial [Thermomicrobiales bacterium]|nr:multicopper oxidase domain-containing protein [Thermomicrobiales bacterium]
MTQPRLPGSSRPASRRINRRRAAAAGMAALGAVALGGASGAGRRALAQAIDPLIGAGGAGGWVEPPVLLSSDRALDVVLDARPVPAAGLGRMGYAGRIPGPTLRFRPGDTVRVLLRNNLGGDQTNLHVHGLHVSPQGNGDNVFVTLDNGQNFQYAYAIPANHPGGTFWYHPHHHGDAQEQVGAGLAGAIVIDGALDAVPGVAGLPERMFVLQGPETRAGESIYTVNGAANPEAAIRPGQTQRWRLANMSANSHFHLQLDGHQFHVIANDGNALPETRPVDTLMLAPGQRADALVQAAEPGRYALRSLAFGEGGQAQPAFPVATLVVAGAPMEPQPLPTAL